MGRARQKDRHYQLIQNIKDGALMVSRKTSIKIRKTHRYLGVFLGIQFLMWTISGLYFSWTNLDNIHGDQYKKESISNLAFDSLLSPTALKASHGIQNVSLRSIAGQPYYYINEKELYHAQTGLKKEGLSEDEAISVANRHLVEGLKVLRVEKITHVNPHHECREKLLPAYVISFNTPDSLKGYVSVEDGKFQTVRHRKWRWFDFLWMTHTMDYEGRDNFNNVVLRAFSMLGLVTVLSGFLLWFVTSPTIKKYFQKLF